MKILFFAHLQEQIGSSEIEWHDSNMTVRELKASLQEKYHGLFLDNCMTAVNEEFTTEESRVSDSDIIAFLPPVSGG